jgi:hypothetical protein
MAKAREVVLEKTAEQELDAQVAIYSRVQDYYRALEWLIARDPSAGYLLGHLSSQHYLIKSQPFRFPVPLILKMVYRVTETQIFIECIQVSTDEPVTI